MKGKVKWFNYRKGYGFIKREDGNDIFVHKNDVPMDTKLDENDQFEIEIYESEHKQQA